MYNIYIYIYIYIYIKNISDILYIMKNIKCILPYNYILYRTIYLLKRTKLR